HLSGGSPTYDILHVAGRLDVDGSVELPHVMLDDASESGPLTLDDVKNCLALPEVVSPRLVIFDSLCDLKEPTKEYTDFLLKARVEAVVYYKSPRPFHRDRRYFLKGFLRRILACLPFEKSCWDAQLRPQSAGPNGLEPCVIVNPTILKNHGC